MTNHYFSQNEPERSAPRFFSYTFGQYKYNFATDSGVFSVGKMDFATDMLIRNVPPLCGSLLDMGCGYGAIGIVLAKEYGLHTLTQADINPRALRLTTENAAQNGVVSEVIQSDGFSQIEKPFDTIVINPPIHAGKGVIFDMYEGARRCLVPGGNLYIVIQKKHGAESSIKRLNEIFGNCEILHKKKGHKILLSCHTSTVP